MVEHAAVNRRVVGSSPTSGANFPLEKATSPVSRTLSEQVSAKVKQHQIVSHYNLEAKIYKGKDGYHAIWHAAGKRKKRQFKKLKDAKEAALKALKLIHKGQGAAANLSGTELDALINTKKLLKESGYTDPVSVALEYIAAKEASDHADLNETAKFWIAAHGGIKAVPFGEAAKDWFKTHKHRWADSTARLNGGLKDTLAGCFEINTCDLNFEVIRLFFEEEIDHCSPKYRNHYRATLKAIIKHCVDRGWLHEKHGLDSLLKKEPDAPQKIDIISPAQFRKHLELAGAELLPIVALQGFTGARRSEARRLNWEDVWKTEGFVVLNPSQTKTKRRRLTERCPALEEWLKPYRSHTGPVWTRSEASLGHWMGRVRKQLGITELKNVLRHSYATYKLALKRDANALALEMGNSPQILMRNYLELATPKEGKQWFGILPRTVAREKLLKVS